MSSPPPSSHTIALGSCASILNIVLAGLGLMVYGCTLIIRLRAWYRRRSSHSITVWIVVLSPTVMTAISILLSLEFYEHPTGRLAPFTSLSENSSASTSMVQIALETINLLMVQTLTIRKVMTLSRNIPSRPPWRTVVRFKVVVVSVLAGIIAISSVVAVSFAGASPHAIMDPKTKLHAAYKIVIHVWNVASAMIAFAICSFYLIIRCSGLDEMDAIAGEIITDRLRVQLLLVSFMELSTGIAWVVLITMLGWRSYSLTTIEIMNVLVVQSASLYHPLASTMWSLVRVSHSSQGPRRLLAATSESTPIETTLNPSEIISVGSPSDESSTATLYSENALPKKTVRFLVPEP